MHRLYLVETGATLGTISAQQLGFLLEHLVLEGATDHDLYVDRDTLALLAEAGADEELLALLDQALADRMEVDIAWDESVDDGSSDRRGPYR